MIKIQVYSGENILKEFESGEDKEISIGRAQGCSVHLDDAAISRLHAVIFPLGGGWVLQRKANFGAVLLNGQEVENAPLEGGEEIKIGAFSLRIQIDSPGATSLTGSKPVVTSSQALAPSEGTQSSDGGTKFVSAGVSALFRMEPGSANLDEFHMEKDVALFGRGSNCDVVLTEKKASRKHFEVRRQGLSFYLKDLNSANGTVVNGNAVTEAELLAGDLIQVGESKLQFSIESREFFAQQDQFLAVPAHLQQDHAPDMGGLGGLDSGLAGAELGLDGQPIPPANMGPDGVPLPPMPTSNTDFIGWFKYKWASIPKAQRMRYLTILVIGSLVLAMLGQPDDEADKKPKVKTRNEKGEIVRIFADLSPKNQKFVKENYKNLLAAHDKKDFTKMFEYARNILSLVDEYNDTKSYEAIAKRGIDALEEEKRRHELEEKQRKVHEEVVKLEEKGKPLFEKAIKDAKLRPELDSLIQEIYAKDPNNHLAADWKQRIKEKIEEEKKEVELARQKEELRQKAEDAYAAVEKIYNDGRFILAIAAADKLVEVGWTEKDYLEKVDKLKKDIREKLKTVLDPLLAEAHNQRQEGGDLVKARDAYHKVLAVDQLNAEAKQGLTDIHMVLLLRAKRLYNEAILSESQSDLADAKDKFEKCLITAPDDENIPPNQDYRRRCQRKLVRFEAFTPESGGKK